MRRAQSVRHYTRGSVSTIGTDDLGALKEVPEESTEVTLRRQLLEKSKENDKVLGFLNHRHFDTDLASLLPVAPRPNSGTSGAARPATADRGHSRITKGIQ